MKAYPLIVSALALSACTINTAAPQADVTYESVANAGASPAERATMQAIDRIEALEPQVNAVIAIFPEAIEEARAVDALQPDSPLAGVPILIKDNIEARGSLPTTAGSLALKDNITQRDAPLVARLRQAGAVILGKTNLSEWANFRSFQSSSGWSAVGGQTRNPYDLTRTPCGSSSGSGAAVASGMVDYAIGTETNGSITCPASMNGIVGFKPSVGLVSRTHIVPISAAQDTAGPMTRTVQQAAIMLTAMAGSDPFDPATQDADARRVDYLAALDGASLDGVRLGVMRFAQGFDTGTAYDEALKALEEAGAILVDIDSAGLGDIGEDDFFLLAVEFKDGLNRYLASTPPSVETRTLEELIAFNAASEEELAIFDQSILELSQSMPGVDDEKYLNAKQRVFERAGPNGIDRLLREHEVVALVGPTVSKAFAITHDGGDQWEGGGAGYLAAHAGYPHLTVPMGFVEGLPVGISFIGAKWDDARILALGHAYEQVRGPFEGPDLSETQD